MIMRRKSMVGIEKIRNKNDGKALPALLNWAARARAMCDTQIGRSEVLFQEVTYLFFLPFLSAAHCFYSFCRYSLCIRSQCAIVSAPNEQSAI